MLEGSMQEVVGLDDVCGTLINAHLDAIIVRKGSHEDNCSMIVSKW